MSERESLFTGREPLPERQYEVVKMERFQTRVVWSGGCRSCAQMIAHAEKRDNPKATVYVR